jgi:hypothetical protein
MTKKERKKMHIASCSFGKDSIATIQNKFVYLHRMNW